MNILCIDPGTSKSGWVIISEERIILDSGITGNPNILGGIEDEFLTGGVGLAIIEMVTSYGMPVGKSTFDTVVWIGAFSNALRRCGVDTRLQTRKDTKKTISSGGADDSHIRQALIDCYQASGGGKTPQIGTKKKPGPLYGVRSHEWAALALGHAYLEGCPKYEMSKENEH